VVAFRCWFGLRPHQGKERRRLIGEYVLAKPDKIDKEDLRLCFHDHCDDPYVDADLPDAP
jgi:hypothetical protein